MATQIIDKFLLPSHNKPNKMYRFKSPDKFNSYEELNQKVQIHCLFTFLGCFSKFGYVNVWQLNHHGNDLDSGGRSIPGNEKGKYQTESCDAHSLLSQFHFQSAY